MAFLPLDRDYHCHEHYQNAEAEILPASHYYGVFLVREVVATVEPLADVESCSLCHAKGLGDALQDIHKTKRQALA